MKKLAYLLIALGFLAGSLVAVQSASNQVNWTLYLPALFLGTMGVTLARVETRQAVTQVDALEFDSKKLTESIDRIVTNISTLDAEKETLLPGDFPDRIDALFRQDLDAFAGARESIAHRHGLPAYAAVMNEFAAGERYLNRIWSASVDGYLDEVFEYLSRARHQFEQTRQELNKLGEPRSSDRSTS